MANLDLAKEINSLDKGNLAKSILELGKQCEQVYKDIGKLELDESYKDARNIVVMGMGGSALGTHIVQSLFANSLKISLEYFNSYHIPGYVNSQTLLILSSYSGSTEEVLSAYNEAKNKTEKILAICSGADLAKLVKDKTIRGYVFDPKHNPSGQPRMGLGYSILSQILILAKLGYLEFFKEDYARILGVISKVNDASKVDIESTENKAKQLSQKFFGKIPFLISSEHLVGNIHTFANQINENAKSLSSYFTLSEADHHLIEGLLSPDQAHKDIIFFFLNSNLYTQRVAKRYPITIELVQKAGIEVVEFVPEGGSKLEQSFEFLTFGSWVSFYLAMLYGRDPSPIPSVDFLKSQMAK